MGGLFKSIGNFFSGGESNPTSNFFNQLQQQPALPKPKVRRMPTETDPAVLAAAQRTRKAALERKGRLSTILTDNSAGPGRETLGA